MNKKRIFAIIILLTMILLVCTGCAVKYPVPNVKEGRFEFTVTYEVDGEEKTYSGVYVCKFDGVYTTFLGSGRMWDAYVENGKDDTAILVKKVGEMEILIDLGYYPEYFMADPDYDGLKPEPTIFGQSIDNKTGEITYYGNDEEFYINYGVKIISYTYAEPIENNYPEKWTLSIFEPSIN